MEVLIPHENFAILPCSLHDEVLAQRALDRKLTDELNKFRGKITSLTQ